MISNHLKVFFAPVKPYCNHLETIVTLLGLNCATSTAVLQCQAASFEKVSQICVLTDANFNCVPKKVKLDAKVGKVKREYSMVGRYKYIYI